MTRHVITGIVQPFYEPGDICPLAGVWETECKHLEKDMAKGEPFPNCEGVHTFTLPYTVKWKLARARTESEE